MTKGYLSLILHAHLPFVRHPEHDDFLEERWLFEAISETYVPLLQTFMGFVKDNVPFKITLSVSPPLANMLSDSLLQERYVNHLDNLINLCEEELNRTKRKDPKFYNLSLFYFNLFTSIRRTYVDVYNCDILRGFKEIAATDQLELTTCAGTHGFMPMMRYHKEAIKGQIFTAVDEHERLFGKAPKGIWVPECGFFPGLDKYLADAGISFFMTDAHGINYADPKPIDSVYAPVMCPSGVAAFGRDLESSKQVWSSEEGYPGDYDYREFYRDVGFDLPFDYIKNYIHKDGIRLNTGIKYYRITGTDSLNNRDIYDPEVARQKADSHASNFMFNREKQIDWLSEKTKNKPIVIAPYDSELFGHWWFEGPQWINYMVRKVAFDQNTFELTTPRHFLESEPELQVAMPAASSWGDKGYYEVWLNGSNDWIYRHLHIAADRMIELAKHPRRNDPLVERAIKQAMRELLLSQSSDWAFIMTTRTAVEYATNRTDKHLERFNRLYTDIKEGTINEEKLAEIETRDNIFPFADPDVFQS